MPDSPEMTQSGDVRNGARSVSNSAPGTFVFLKSKSSFVQKYSNWIAADRSAQTYFNIRRYIARYCHLSDLLAPKIWCQLAHYVRRRKLKKTGCRSPAAVRGLTKLETYEIGAVMSNNMASRRGTLQFPVNELDRLGGPISSGEVKRRKRHTQKVLTVTVALWGKFRPFLLQFQ
ncbi:hypothetical protein C8R44DRAFT_731564 [Mycena epipterygia]|nr:hypothetical protein C8R44DRAFT_731564 [Mycena epipterygia]